MPVCFACRRPAHRFDWQVYQWVCEGYGDCGMSRTAQKRETPQELARVLEQEHPCQTCRNPAARLFDGLYLCGACRRAAWKKLYREAYGC